MNKFNIEDKVKVIYTINEGKSAFPKVNLYEGVITGMVKEQCESSNPYMVYRVSLPYDTRFALDKNYLEVREDKIFPIEQEEEAKTACRQLIQQFQQQEEAEKREHHKKVRNEVTSFVHDAFRTIVPEYLKDSEDDIIEFITYCSEMSWLTLNAGGKAFRDVNIGELLRTGILDE